MSRDGELRIYFGILSILVLVPLAYIWLMPHAVPVNGDLHDSFSDWMFMYAYEDALFHFKEWPFWNPFLGGGIYFSGHNTARGFQAFTLFTLAFGHVIGMKLIISLCFIFGVIGTWGFCSDVLKLKNSGAFFAAACIAGSSWFPNRVYDGNYTEISYILIPFCAWLFYRSLRGSIGATLLFAICFQAQVVDARPAFIFSSLLCLMAMKVAYQELTTKAATVIKAGILMAAAVFMAGPKILPFLHGALSHATANTTQLEWIQPKNFFAQYFLNKKYPSIMMMGINWPIVIFVLLGVVASFRRTWGLVLMLAVSLLILFGHDSPIDLYAVMLRLPVLKSLGSVSSHFSFWILVLLVALAGFWTDLLNALTSPRVRMALVLGLTVVVIAPSFKSYLKFFPKYFGPNVLDYTPEKSFFQVKVLSPFSNGTESLIDKDTRWRRMELGYAYTHQYQNYRRGVGTIEYYCSDLSPEHTVPKYFIDYDKRVPNSAYLGEAYLVSPKGTQANLPFALTYNTVSVEVPERSYAGRLVINQNFHPLWNSPDASVSDWNGLISLNLEAGPAAKMTLKFFDKYFYQGLFLFALGLLLLIAMITHQALSRRLSNARG